MLYHFVLIGLGFAGSCFAQRTYTITDLGTLGGPVSSASAINNLGEATGFSLDGAGRQRAFLYRAGQGMTDIGNVAVNRSFGTGINGRGQVTMNDFFAGDVLSVVGLLYIAPNPALRLLLPGGTQSEVRAINKSGQVAGSGNTGGAGSNHPFLYTPGVGLVDLDPAATSGSAWGINNFGVVAGGVATQQTTSSAAIYTPAAGRTMLGMPGVRSLAYGVNDLGQVVGEFGAVQQQPFLYTQAGGMQNLVGLSPQDNATALGINNAGEVVGTSGGRAFVYTQAGGVVDLNSRIPAFPEWLLTTATAINDLGQITGQGLINHQTHGFILTPVETPLYTGPARFVPVTPCRLVDTRVSGPAVAGGSVRRFVPAGSCGVPATATAYSLNVTVVPRGPLGYLTIWPSGRAQPNVSTLNSFDGRVKANAAIVPAGLGGSVDVFATDTTDVVLDVNGYFVPLVGGDNLSFYPLIPCRVADTRDANGSLGGPKLNSAQPRTFPIRASQCGIPASAQAYSLNFTSVPNGPLGFLTTWPTGSPQPLVSTLNAPTGTVTANAAIVPAGANGSIDVFATNASDLVIDVNGYFAVPGSPGAMAFHAVTPCRVADTRTAGGVMNAGETREFAVRASACGVPFSANAYSFNATVVPRVPLAFLRLSPFGNVSPASTLNAFDGAVTSNAAIVPAGTNGSISGLVTNATDLILDINGYFTP